MNKLNKKLRVLFAIAMVFSVTISSLAQKFEIDGIFYNITSEIANTVEVTSWGYDSDSNGYMGEIIIPELITYNETTYSVTSIGYAAFYDCININSIIIPNSVTKIGTSAFCGCTKLTSITIPNSVISIGSEAFHYTGWYENQPDGILYLDNCCLGYKNNKPVDTLILKDNTRLISDEAFKDCKSLTSAIIPNSVVSIGWGAFYNCTGLTEIAIPNSATTIGSMAFSGCSGLTEITIPNSVTSMGSSTFSNCTKLTEVNYNAENCSSMDLAFGNCPNLTTLSIGKGVISIPNSAFRDINSLQIVNLNAVNCISMGTDSYPVFRNCLKFKKLNIGDGVKNIPSSAFYGCSKLTSITIPNSVTSIGSSAFYNCTGLTEVNISDLSAWCKIDFGHSSANPLSYANKLKLNGVEIKDLVIPNDITKIKDYAFYNCNGLTSITIPNSVIEIGTSAFYSCDELTSISIPNSVIKINDFVFSGCTTLHSAIIGNSVTSIGSYAFSHCSGLTSITIGNSVNKINQRAFENCSKLTEVNIQDLSAWCKIDFYDYYANPLYYANKLKLNGTEIKDLVIPNDISKIKKYAFYGHSELTSVTISQSVKEIETDAFYGAWNLKKIVSINPTPPTVVKSSFYTSNYSNATLYVPKDSYAKYFIDDVWGQFSSIQKIDTLVSSVKLDSSSIELEKGENITLTAIITPTNATITDVVWNSSNPSIAMVDQSGKVTALAAGSSLITASTVDGSNINASCLVTVSDVKTKITLSQTEANIFVNDVITLTYSVVPSTTAVEWTTSNANIAYIKKNSDKSLTVVGVSGGIATISATALDDSNVSASCIVTVTKLAETISLDKTEKTINIGDSLVLTATVSPDDTSNKTVVWSVSDDTLATIKDNGDGSATLTSNKLGEVIVSATTTDGTNLVASCKVIITQLATSIMLDKEIISIVEGKSETLTATVLPDNTSNKKVEWSSSNESVATVVDNYDGSATITIHKKGIATITATTTDGSNLSAICKVSGLSGILSIGVDDIEEKRYDIHGRLLSKPSPGLNIVISSDGSTRKEIIK